MTYNASMANRNPLVGIIPRVLHPVNDGERH